MTELLQPSIESKTTSIQRAIDALDLLLPGELDLPTVTSATELLRPRGLLQSPSVLQRSGFKLWFRQLMREPAVEYQALYSIPDPVEELISESRDHLLSLKEGWDGEGSPSYKPETFDAAADYLRSLAMVISSPYLSEFRFLPYTEGTIELHLRVKDKLDFLMSFEADGSVSYYGDDFGHHTIQGKGKPRTSLIRCWIQDLLL